MIGSGSISKACGAVAAVHLAVAAGTAVAEPRHGLSTFGDLKYPPDFPHFDYVNPDAPKGGELRLRDLGSFDNLNPFILKGIRLRGVGAAAVAGLPFDTLMTPAGDEPDAMYGLVAESAETAPDRSWASFRLRPEARFNDGSPLTAEDVVFSFETLKARGEPSFRIVLRDVESATAEGPHRVRFAFREGAVTRDLPLTVAGLPILSRAHYETRAFDRTTLDPPLGSGPYRIVRADQGRTIVYERVADYWARDLPVNRGRFNYGVIRFDFYRDRNIALEAFKAGEYDFREEFTSKMWATAYDFPAIEEGLVKRESIPDESPANRQFFVLNQRREIFRDRRVRAAFDLAFDFEWTNRNIFYGLYERTRSLFQNTPMAARGLPGPEEVALLEPYRDGLPAEVFTRIFDPPATDGSGNARRNLRAARKLLREAGYAVKDGKLRDPSGRPVSLEFLTFSPTFERVYAPLVRNLGRLGVEAAIRIVDSAQYANRMQEFDFDVTTAAFGGVPTPGVGERNFWGSEAARSPGSLNYAGIADPVVDALIEKIADAPDRESLETAARALDRALLWNRHVVPQWFNANHNIAYWDKFARPRIAPRYDGGFGFLDTWWIDPDKAAALEARRAARE